MHRAPLRARRGRQGAEFAIHLSVPVPDNREAAYRREDKIAAMAIHMITLPDEPRSGELRTFILSHETGNVLM